MLYALHMLVNTLAKQVQGLYHKYGPTFSTLIYGQSARYMYAGYKPEWSKKQVTVQTEKSRLVRCYYISGFK